MSDREPHTRHTDDIETDGEPPTDAVSDEVKQDAVQDQLDPDDVPDRPAQTHP